MDIQHLIDQFRGPLLGLLASWGASPADAHDLCQDTFVEAYLGRARLQGDPGDPRVVGPWLRGIARNLHRAHCRQSERTRTEDPSPVAMTRLPSLDGTSSGSAQGGAWEDPAEAVRAAITRLKPELATVLCMHYLEETSVRTVAAMLELPEKTVEGRLYRGRVQLRRLLEEAPQSFASQGGTSTQNDPSTTGSER